MKRLMSTNLDERITVTDHFCAYKHKYQVTGRRRGGVRGGKVVG